MLSFLLSAMLLFAPVQESTRMFNVSIEQRHGGHYSQTITEKDGVTTVKCESVVSIHVKVLFVRRDYDYSYNGTEVWKGGKLISLTSTTNDNGELRKTDIDEKQAKDYVWSTSYWFLPPKELHEKPMKLVDSDTGQCYNVRIFHMGKDRIGNRYAVRGDMNCDLWYNDKGQLERREMSRKGYKTVVQKRLID